MRPGERGWNLASLVCARRRSASTPVSPCMLTGFWSFEDPLEIIHDLYHLISSYSLIAYAMEVFAMLQHQRRELVDLFLLVVPLFQTLSKREVTVIWDRSGADLPYQPSVLYMFFNQILWCSDFFKIIPHKCCFQTSFGSCFALKSFRSPHPPHPPACESVLLTPQGLQQLGWSNSTSVGRQEISEWFLSDQSCDNIYI